MEKKVTLSAANIAIGYLNLLPSCAQHFNLRPIPCCLESANSHE